MGKFKEENKGIRGKKIKNKLNLRELNFQDKFDNIN